jgi:hypothetical protein
MIPNIFVSSTIQDLQHLRDAVRETILELSYNPVMSDYGDIGYLTSITAEESCYLTMRDCQIVILIIGKRYGSISQNGLSITHNEFHSAKEHKIPIISLIEHEVMSFKRVYDANVSKGIEQIFPGMDSPTNTFSFIQAIMSSPLNNGILQFSTATDARQHLKKQLALLFGDLLSRKFDPVKGQLYDVLSEVKTLRHELLKDKGPEPIQYLRATRLLLDDKREYRQYGDFIKCISMNIEEAIPKLIVNDTFDDFIKSYGGTLMLIDKVPNFDELEGQKRAVNFVIEAYPSEMEKGSIGFYSISENNHITVNDKAKKYFDNVHIEFKKALVG